MQLSDIGEQSVDKGSRQHQMSAAVVLRWAALDSNYTPTIYHPHSLLYPLSSPLPRLGKSKVFATEINCAHCTNF